MLEIMHAAKFGSRDAQDFDSITGFCQSDASWKRECLCHSLSHSFDPLCQEPRGVAVVVALTKEAVKGDAAGPP